MGEAKPIEGRRSADRWAGIGHVQLAIPPGVERCHLPDPFGNRIELIDVDSLAAQTSTESAD